MTQDLLTKATKALSESGHEQQGGRFTRERLMGSLHDRKRRSNTRFAVFLPLAAIFVGSTAFAAATGSLHVFVMSALNVVGMAPSESGEKVHPPEAEKSEPSPIQARPAAAAPVASSVEPERAADEAPPASATAVEPVSGRSELPPARQTAAPRASSASASLSEHRVVENDAHATYRAAHVAQFKRNDCGTALAGYAEYLAQQPAGRFAVDARYNRILCLVRLGRAAEARVDLQRFADGAYGGYRQADAERLLAALDEAK